MPTTAFFVSFWRMSCLALAGKFPHFVSSMQGRQDVRIDNLPQIAWLVIAALFTYAWPLPSLLFYWAPMVFYFPMVFLTSLPEHYGCDEGEDVTRNTRTIRSNWLFRTLFWNGNFHAEHHLYPTVPSHNLPKLHALIGDHFAFRERSYVRFHGRLILDLLLHRQANPQASKDTPDPQKRINYELYEEPAHGPPSKRLEQR
jgi:fatty acid desaturase